MTKPNPDYDRAISDFTIATERHHGFAEPYDNRGIAYMKKPDPITNKPSRTLIVR